MKTKVACAMLCLLEWIIIFMTLVASDCLISEISRCHINPQANKFSVYFIYCLCFCPWSWHWVEREAPGERHWVFQGSALLGLSASPSEEYWWCLCALSHTYACCSVNTKRDKGQVDLLPSYSWSCTWCSVPHEHHRYLQGGKILCFNKSHYLVPPFPDNFQSCGGM